MTLDSFRSLLQSATPPRRSSAVSSLLFQAAHWAILLNLLWRVGRRRAGDTQEAGRRTAGDTQEAGRRRPGDTQEAGRRKSGDNQEAARRKAGQETCRRS